VKRTFLAGVVMLDLLVSAPVVADEVAVFKQAANNLSHEFSDGWVYFQISMQCMRNRTDSAETIAKYETVSDYALAMSQELGKEAGVSENAMLARQTLAAQDMMSAIDRNCSNISVLLLKYASSCKALREEEAEPMMNRAMEQARRTLEQ
jgi:hypothetical protein